MGQGKNNAAWLEFHDVVWRGRLVADMEVAVGP